MDFSGSTNLVLLPSTTAPATLDRTTTTGEVVVEAKDEKGHEEGGRDEPEGDNGGKGVNVETRVEVDSMRGADETRGGVDSVNGVDETASEEEPQGESTMCRGVVVTPLSAGVSVEAFCRTVVARVAVRDPEAAGTMKVIVQAKLRFGWKCRDR